MKGTKASPRRLVLRWVSLTVKECMVLSHPAGLETMAVWLVEGMVASFLQTGNKSITVRGRGDQERASEDHCNGKQAGQVD